MHWPFVSVVCVMARAIPDACLELHSSTSTRNPHRDSGILSDAARVGFFIRFALFFESRRSLPCRQRRVSSVSKLRAACSRQWLPRLGIKFPSKLLLRCFLQGCVVTTAQRLVIAPASVFVDARKKIILRNRIFARVMSGFVAREEVLLQADAAARIAGKSGVIDAARSGDVDDVLSYLIADANCVNERDGYLG